MQPEHYSAGKLCTYGFPIIFFISPCIFIYCLVIFVCLFLIFYCYLVFILSHKKGEPEPIMHIIKGLSPTHAAAFVS